MKGLCWSFLLSLGVMHAQTGLKDIAVKENIHLHLNKTQYLKGEVLWFKAYLWDQDHKMPSMGTKNLHVAMYNASGKEIRRKLLVVESGMAQGHFAIDSVLTDDEYTLLAWTNSMPNVAQLPPFQQRIQILNDAVKSEVSLAVNMKISIYPEGGQLIEEAYNTIGMFIENGSGQGVQVDDLELVDQRGKRIRSNIITNHFGMGKTAFFVEAGKSYYLQRKREGFPIIRQLLPNATKDQVGLSINNLGQEKVFFRMVSSKSMFSEKDGDTYVLGVYQDDFLIMENISIDEREPVISLTRKELPFGPLVATLFDEGLRPVAHRMFFNHKNQENIVRQLEIDHCLTEFGDSLQVDLSLPKDVQEAMVSLSALPKESLAYDADNSIVSSFFLKPYINGAFQDRYFFEGMDRRKRYELDVRLMIAGWGRYDWDSRKQDEVQLALEKETGIPFHGKVLDADLSEENQVALLAQLSSEVAFVELDDNKSFKGHMQLYQGDSLGISLVDKKGILRKPNVELKFGKLMDRVQPTVEWLKEKVIEKQNDGEEEKSIDEPLTIEERTIALEEVVVTESIYKFNKTEMFVTGDGIISEGRIIGDPDIKRYNSVLAYLSTLGYKYSKGLDADGFYVDVLLNPKNNIPVNVDPMLLNLPLSRVQAIYFDVDKKVFVGIVLRETAYESPEQRKKFVKFAIENGYARPQVYFTPNYSDYGGQLFKSYGALDWKANISLSSEIPTTVKIPLKNQAGLQLHIEGMDGKGSLISQKEYIGLEP